MEFLGRKVENLELRQDWDVLCLQSQKIGIRKGYLSPDQKNPAAFPETLEYNFVEPTRLKIICSPDVGREVVATQNINTQELIHTEDPILFSKDFASLCLSLANHLRTDSNGNNFLWSLESHGNQVDIQMLKDLLTESVLIAHNQGDISLASYLLLATLILKNNSMRLVKYLSTPIITDVRTIYTKDLGIGLMHTFSLLNHSCKPNAYIDFNGMGARLFALRPISAGEAIRITYGPLAGRESLEERQHFLKLNYSFKCACHSCTLGDTMISDSVKEIYGEYSPEYLMTIT